jgi:DNA invertase Pin-like site-specific DNA recombinase
MALIGYARVSTDDQTPQLQLDALQAAGCVQVFHETISGSVKDRPQLQAALDYLRPTDTLVVWKLDRLARSLSHLIGSIQTLEQRQCGFRSLTEAVDTATAGGRLIFHIFGALAEFERALIRERTIAGLKGARERGRIGGRPSVMTPERLTAAKALLEDGQLTIKQVAKQLGVSEATIYKHIPQPRLLSFDELGRKQNAEAE